VVLDPGHGGADAGARGPSGVLEKDVTLHFALAARAELEKQNFRVVLTRERDENPSFDDRAALANSQRHAVFLTLHVSSTGPAGTARAYYLGLPGAAPQPSRATQAAAKSEKNEWVRWEEAQFPFLAASRRLAELIQAQLRQSVGGSPEEPGAAWLRQLRPVAAPAVAVEVSSVAVARREQLERMAPAVATAMVRAVAEFRSAEGAGH